MSVNITDNMQVAVDLSDLRYLVFKGMSGKAPRINTSNYHWEVYDNDTQAWVDTGLSAVNGAPGSDGVSPTLTVADITGGHRITITDAEHPNGQTVDVVDGTDYVLTEQDKEDIAGSQEVADAVGNWLDENLSGETEVVIDSSLSVEGAAADAKASGDRLAVLEDNTPIKRVINSAYMTDQSAVYFYVGEEDNYEKYSLYYYNGTEWTTLTSSSAAVAAQLPELRIYGDISVLTAQKNEEKIYTYKWLNAAEQDYRTGFCSLKWQGESSLIYPKKNYTIKFFDDSSYSRKDKTSFFDKLILKKNKWVVKANWVDRSMAKNIVSCRLWGQVVKSRSTAPISALKSTPNYGAVNGYPIQIYVNDVWHGLYTFNIPKDEDLFGMDEENPKHCAICGDSQSVTSATAFRQATTNGWALEVPEDAWPKWTTEEEVDGQTVEVTHRVADGLVALINFVMTATDEEFKSDLNNYLDVESAIDYYLMSYYDCGVDSLGRNLILLTYNGGEKWYCSLYDADTTWGNGENGAGTYNAELPCPEGYGMYDSLLWERMEECFGQELYDRWTELRKTVFDVEYIQSQFNLFWSAIPEKLFDKDVERWHGVDPVRPDIPQWNINVKTAILDFIEDRAAYCDAQIRAMRPAVPCTGITLDESSIAFSNGTPITLTATVTPENTTDDVVWSVSDSTVVQCVNGVVTPLKNGTATVTATCGSYSATCSVSVTGLAFYVSLVGSHATVTPTSEITPNAAYNGVVAADENYELTSVVITMGGVDITSTCYNSTFSAISIPSVTGDIVVTVTTEFQYDTTGLEYRLTNPFTADGVSFVDTGVTYNGTDPLTIAMDITLPYDIVDENKWMLGAKLWSDSVSFGFRNSYRGWIYPFSTNVLSTGVPATPRDRVKVILRYNATTKVLASRATSEDEVAQGRNAEVTSQYGHGTLSGNMNEWTLSLYLGGLHISTGLSGATDSGTFHDFRIYTRRWSDAEVKNYLGVDSLSTIFTDDMDNYASS